MLRAPFRAVILGALLIGLSSMAGAASQATVKPKPAGKTAAKPPVNANAAILVDFQKRVEGYVALHKKLEATLPALSTEATPQAIDTHQRALAKLLQDARKDAKAGAIFTPGMQRLVRNTFRPTFSGKEGAQIKAEILDNEYKGGAPLAVNARYPDEVPISTMPPQVLAGLPKLTEELEYRFIQNNLILFDPHSHLIVDFMVRAFN